jgi:hypothetical protein
MQKNSISQHLASELIIGRKRKVGSRMDGEIRWLNPAKMTTIIRE